MKKKTPVVTREDLIEAYLAHGSLSEVAKSLGINTPACRKLWYETVRVKPWVLDRPDPIDNSKSKVVVNTLSIPYHHDDVYRIGVVSDTHLGSCFQQLSSLRNFYGVCQEQGVSVILHGGDLIDGTHKYQGQEGQIFIESMTAILNYTARNYPEVDGVETQYIVGNHNTPSDYTKELNALRPDLICIGNRTATLRTPDGTRIHIQHGGGQRRVQPNDILLLGHWHRFITLDQRGSSIIQLPCFHNSTLRPDYVQSDIGGLIIEFGKRVTPRISISFINYEKMLEDY